MNFIPAVYIPVIYFLFPETNNRSLEDINAHFGEEVAIHLSGATSAEEKEYEHAIQIEEGQKAGRAPVFLVETK
ncbi:hypothetical protein B0A49_13581, partial [Cryomyces minteri]